MKESVEIKGYKIFTEFLKRPICCNHVMDAAGGELGKKYDDSFGDKEHFWKCGFCGKEIVDIIAQIL